MAADKGDPITSFPFFLVAADKGDPITSFTFFLMAADKGDPITSKGPAVQWSITCLVRLTYVFMALPATGVNLAWCLVSYRVALSRMASSILFVHILTGLASSIVASISLRPLVTPRLTLSYLATLRLRHLQLLILAGGSVFGGTKTMVAMRGDCFYSDGPPPTQGGRSQN